MIFPISLAGQLYQETILTSDIGTMYIHHLCFPNQHREWEMTLEPHSVNKCLDLLTPILEIYSPKTDRDSL